MPPSNIPKKPLVEVIPVAVDLGSNMDALYNQLAKDTGASLPMPSVQLTPLKRHVESAETATGSKLVEYSPFRVFEVEKKAGEGDVNPLRIVFLIRERDRKPAEDSLILKTMRDSAAVGSPVVRSVVATKETRENNPPRKTARKEKAVVGKSAKDVILKYFKDNHPELNLEEVLDEVNKLKFNLCHTLSYALANRAISENGGEFDTQQKENIFAGTRQLNEAVFPIELSLLNFIEENEVAEIKYVGVCTPYEDIHAIAKLHLSATMVTHEGKEISFIQEFIPDETRYISSEVTAIVNAALKIMVHTPDQTPKQQSVKPVAPSDTPTAVKSLGDEFAIAAVDAGIFGKRKAKRERDGDNDNEVGDVVDNGSP